MFYVQLVHLKKASQKNDVEHNVALCSALHLYEIQPRQGNLYTRGRGWTPSAVINQLWACLFTTCKKKYSNLPTPGPGKMPPAVPNDHLPTTLRWSGGGRAPSKKGCPTTLRIDRYIDRQGDRVVGQPQKKGARPPQKRVPDHLKKGKMSLI